MDVCWASLKLYFTSGFLRQIIRKIILLVARYVCPACTVVAFLSKQLHIFLTCSQLIVIILLLLVVVVLLVLVSLLNKCDCLSACLFDT